MKKISLSEGWILRTTTLVLPLALCISWFLILVPTFVIVFKRNTVALDNIIKFGPVALISTALWLKATYRMSDLKRMLRTEGAIFKSPPFFKSLINWGIGLRTMIASTKDYIVAGELDISTIGALNKGNHSFYGKRKDSSYTTSAGTIVPFESTSSVINFFLLAELPAMGRFEIFKKTDRCESPQTGVKEIDRAIADLLARDTDVHLVLVLNQDNLKIMVLGGAWLGSRYEARIRRAMQLAKRLSAELRLAYPTKKRLEDYKVYSTMSQYSYSISSTY